MDSKENKHPLMNIEEVGIALRISETTIYRFIEREWLKPIKIGNATRFKREDVEYIMENGTPNQEFNFKW